MKHSRSARAETKSLIRRERDREGNPFHRRGRHGGKASERGALGPAVVNREVHILQRGGVERDDPGKRDTEGERVPIQGGLGGGPRQRVPFSGKRGKDDLSRQTGNILVSPPSEKKKQTS